ncbi:30S ribosome-binding factor RbfA [Clostridium cylindrosporum]|uniref:Ribosome-binding factor A n=1 Tax=Clostridium cylindrosporum DSM 605 TaxID=1121307 RepID=A0A0J8DFW9_CLOCY|nr:30S ribosome-binding factor RbfA [Clostridium cylindrosporum]KMT23063.1 ribosome-binding factor A [Clostridium cylindrosporum DSM 605]
MAFNRTVRLSEEIRKILSEIIQNNLKDPRIPILTTVTRVDVTRDLRYAKAYISVFGEKEDKVKCIEGLRSASGYIRREVGSRIKVRYTPEILFEIDESLEHGLHINKILSDINKGE